MIIKKKKLQTFPNYQQCLFPPFLASLRYFTPTVFEEPEDPSSRSFFSEIISSISDVKFSHSGRYMMTRDYLSVKVWDLNMENRPVETYQVPALSCLGALERASLQSPPCVLCELILALRFKWKEKIP